MDELVNVGFIARTHGIKGELKISIENIYLNAFRKLEAFFIGTLPYFVENLSVRKNDAQIIIKLEGVNNIEQAEKLVGKKISVRQNNFSDSFSENKYNYIIGYTFIDEKSKEEIGVVKDILEMPMQNIAVVVKKENELLIPLNKNTLKKTDKKEKRIIVQLPEGLIEVYGK